MSELTQHIMDMMDSLDEHVTHDEVYMALSEAWALSTETDAEVERLRERISELGWAASPDRMGQ